jgi:hypothetical protein
MHTASLVMSEYRGIGEEDNDTQTPVYRSDLADGPRRDISETIELSDTKRRTRSRVVTGNPSGLLTTPSPASSSEAGQRHTSKVEARRDEKEVSVSVVEQRVSNLLQGCFCKCLTLWHAILSNVSRSGSDDSPF